MLLWAVTGSDRSDYQPAITEHSWAVGVWNSSACPPPPACYFMRSIRWDDPIDSATPTPILNAQRLLNTQTIREQRGTRSAVIRQLQVEKGDINLTHLNLFDSL